jgi:hypothetical protein
MTYMIFKPGTVAALDSPSGAVSEKIARPERNMLDGLKGDLIMRAAILVAGCFLISSSAFAVEPQLNTNTAVKPVVVALATMPTPKAVARETTRGAAIETPMTEGSLEKFGSTGLPQYTMPTPKAAAHKATRVAAVETPMAAGSLEKFGATGLPQ